MPAQTYEPFDWYATPLYYDIIFDADTDAEADFLDAVWARHQRVSGDVLSRKRRVLEPACGSGRLLAALGERGWDVAGFDAEAEMVEFARQRLQRQGLRGQVVEGRFDGFALRGGRAKSQTAGTGFDLAFCLVSSFKYVVDEAEAQRHLKLLAEHLQPGGLYVLGLHVTDYSDRRGEVERWRATRDGVEVRCTIKSWPPDRATRTEAMRSRLTVIEGAETKRYESRWTFRTYSVGQLRELLKTEPRLKHVATYDFHHDPSRRIRLGDENLGVVLVLRKL